MNLIVWFCNLFKQQMLQHSLYRIIEKELPCFMVQYDRYFESHDHVACLEILIFCWPCISVYLFLNI